MANEPIPSATDPRAVAPASSANGAPAQSGLARRGGATIAPAAAASAEAASADATDAAATGAPDAKAAVPTAIGCGRLHLYQLVSPALPVGAFSYSEGLEVLVQSGRLGSAAAVQAWLVAEVEHGTLRLEAAALPGLMTLLQTWQQQAGQEHDAAAARQQLIERDGWLLAQREASELRAQQRQMGGSLLQLLADLGWPLPQPLPLAWPAAFAWAGHCLAVPAAELVEAFLYGWVANQLSAAVRLVPLGPTEAQRLQLQLAAIITAQAANLARTDPGNLWNGGVGAGLAQLAHRSLYSRLFRS